MVVPMSVTARLNYVCPRCGAKKGDYCTTPKGRKLYGAVGGIHGERMRNMTQAEIKLSELKPVSGQEFMNRIAKAGGLSGIIGMFGDK